MGAREETCIHISVRADLVRVRVRTPLFDRTCCVLPLVFYVYLEFWFDFQTEGNARDPEGGGF